MLQKTNRTLNKVVVALTLAVLLSLGTVLAVTISDTMTNTKAIDGSSLKQVSTPFESAGGHPLSTHSVKPVLHGLVGNYTIEASKKPAVATLPCKTVVTAMELIAAGETEAIFDRVSGHTTASYRASLGAGGIAVFADEASFGIANARVEGSDDAHTVTCPYSRASCTDSSAACTVAIEAPQVTASATSGRRLSSLPDSFQTDYAQGRCEWKWEGFHESGKCLGYPGNALKLKCRRWTGSTWIEYTAQEQRETCCHPATSIVELADGATKSMDSLSVGDRIRTPSGFQPVEGFLHQERESVGDYYHFTTADGATMAISAWHHLVVDGEWRDPADVTVGMQLKSALSGRDVSVTAIEMKRAEGAYHPFVRGGEYYVDGLLATDYNAHVPRSMWSLVRSYVALRYRLGVPVIPEGHGKVFASPFWAYDSVMDPLGVPTVIQWLLSPLLVGTVVASELLNLAVESPQLPLAAVGLSLYFTSWAKGSFTEHFLQASAIKAKKA